MMGDPCWPSARASSGSPVSGAPLPAPATPCVLFARRQASSLRARTARDAVEPAAPGTPPVNKCEPPERFDSLNGGISGNSNDRAIFRGTVSGFQHRTDALSMMVLFKRQGWFYVRNARSARR